jgi:hypothetical protein
MSKAINNMPEREPCLHELDDRTQLDIILEGVLIHSDFTIHGSDTYRIKRILEHTEEANGCVREEDLKKVFKSKEQLAAYIRIYGLTPWYLESFTASVLAGNIKLTGGQGTTYDHHVDILGLFIELTERFKFKKGIVYQALAEHLDIPGHGKQGDNNAYTQGAEAIRQTIEKLKKQLKKA